MEALYENPNFISVCEFLPNHLYFVTVQNINNGGSCDAIIPPTDDLHFFSTDNELIYHNFYGDFGPLGITSLYKFCKKLTNKLATYAGDHFYEKFVTARFGRKDIAEKLREKFIKKKVVVYYTSTNNEKRANAAFLIAAFAVLYLGYSPRLAYKVLQPTKMRYRAFQDASVGLSPYKINMKDCLDALHKASVFGFFNFNDFNAAECSYYENIEHGDLNWIIPQKFIAFPGPIEEKNDYYHHPNFYIEYFLCNNVTDVIRLNQRAYDPKCFTMFNIKHHDLYMQDGTDPPESILKSFMNVAETANGAIAVHCKAGLGRTGSLIGAYLLKHYRMTAKEAIAWIRICRPGSVIGHQQTWLENHEELLWYEGNQWRFKMYGKTEIVPFLQYGIYSYEAPKKEYPGLRELLTNLTKRARYRFIVKNRSKKSKTRLQQMIRNLLENGKSTKEEKEVERKPVKPAEVPPAVESKPSIVSKVSNPIISSKQLDFKNVQYLKPPPQIEDDTNAAQQPYGYEYSQQEYRKPMQQKDPYLNEFEPVPTFPCTPEFTSPPSASYAQPSSIYPFPAHTYDNKLQAMYSNPNNFYNNYSDSDFTHYGGEKRPYATITPTKTTRAPEMPKAYSDQINSKFDRGKSTNNSFLSKSIDKNWKQNAPGGMKFFIPNSPGKKFGGKGSNLAHQYGEEICAFDSRVDTISQFSRFNKPFLGKGYLDPTEINSQQNEYGSEIKLKGYDYTKPPSRQNHGFLLSPEDLQSWVETFDEKIESQGDKSFGLKRSTVI